MTRSLGSVLAVLGLLVGPLCGTAQPAPATASHSRPAEQEPAPGDVEAQHAQVLRLRAEAQRQAARVDDAQQALRGAAVLAGLALEEYAVAVRALHDLQQSQAQRQRILASAQQQVEAARRNLGQWARHAYRGGTGLAGHPTVTTVLTASRDGDLGTNREVLRRIGRRQGRELADLEQARRRADAAAAAAATASEAAAAGAVRASAARDASQRAVATQRRLLAIAETSLADADREVRDAQERENGLRAARLARAQAQAQARGLRQTGAGGNRVTGQVGQCAGGAVEQYPNGRIPVAALCPLVSAPGHHLRADAAYAFDRLSRAYAERFGRPICVTDSYRSYEAQVSVYARKPGLAAVPGTSNHGWGTATDLCGGVSDFASSEHRWLALNASLHGWYHPGWAQQNGSKPEPWHWEFGG